MNIEKTVPKKTMYNSNWFLYGAPGIGKTTLASQFPKSLFIYTEAGQGFVSSDCVLTEHDNQVFTSFKEIQFVVNGILKDPEYKENYDVIWFDTVDNFIDLAFRHVCDLKHVEHASDLQWGKGWDLTSQEIKLIISKLQSVGFTLGFISHEFSKDHQFKGRTITKIIPNLGTTARKAILPLVDFIGYMYMSPIKIGSKLVNKRAISFVMHSEYESKDRSGLFTEPIILEDSNTCYSRLEEVWNKKVSAIEEN